MKENKTMDGLTIKSIANFLEKLDDEKLIEAFLFIAKEMAERQIIVEDESEIDKGEEIQSNLVLPIEKKYPHFFQKKFANE